MIKRKLASIQTISNIESIENADMIVKISFLNIGWVCVATKDQFQIGEKVVYFEIDSLLPVMEQFKFLEKGGGLRTMFTGETGYRLRTVKLRGQVSQGLAIPITEFNNLDSTKLNDGEDITKILNVLKWEREPEISMEGDIVADYPSHTSRSGQTRIQNALEFFDLYKDVQFEKSVKLEGTSVSYHLFNDEYSTSSHNTVYANNDKFSAWKYANDIKLEAALRFLNRNITIQCEFIGPKINGNIEGLREKEARVYDIWDIDTSRFLNQLERFRLLDEINRYLKINYNTTLKHVPIVKEKMYVFQEYSTLDKLLLSADGKNDNNRYQEGHVYKSIDYIDGYVISFKVISNKYLLKLKD